MMQLQADAELQLARIVIHSYKLCDSYASAGAGTL